MRLLNRRSLTQYVFTGNLQIGFYVNNVKVRTISFAVYLNARITKSCHDFTHALLFVAWPMALSPKDCKNIAMSVINKR
jgi:hypothetical protein